MKACIWRDAIGIERVSVQHVRGMGYHPGSDRVLARDLPLDSGLKRMQVGPHQILYLLNGSLGPAIARTFAN